MAKPQGNTVISGAVLPDNVKLYFGADKDVSASFNPAIGWLEFRIEDIASAQIRFLGANFGMDDDNVFFSGPTITDGIGQLAFGNATTPPTGVGANSISLWAADIASSSSFHIADESGNIFAFGNGIFYGSIASGGDLTLQSTAHATKGKILFGTSAYDEVNNRLGVGTAAPDESLEVFGAGAILRLRDSGATADATLAFIEFGGTDTGSWVRTGYVGDISSANTHIHLQAELGELHLGDSSGGSVLVLSGGLVGINVATPVTRLTLGGIFSIKEQASADAPTAAYGQIWVKTATPNELWFTNDAAADFRLA